MIDDGHLTVYFDPTERNPQRTRRVLLTEVITLHEEFQRKRSST
jgi:hypothetical protein